MKNKCRNKEYKHFIFILLHSLNSKFKLYKRWIIQLKHIPVGAAL